MNGISGAVLSVVVKKEAAEKTLSKGIARNLMKNVYPDTTLPNQVAKSLREDEVHQPMTTAMSPLQKLEAAEQGEDQVASSTAAEG